MRLSADLITASQCREAGLWLVQSTLHISDEGAPGTSCLSHECPECFRASNADNVLLMASATSLSTAHVPV